jgi:IMP dehydrogenase/GMP reductase
VCGGVYSYLWGPNILLTGDILLVPTRSNAVSRGFRVKVSVRVRIRFRVRVKH